MPGPAEPPAAPPRARIAHAMPGRLRLRLEAVPEPGALLDALAALPGMARVVLRPGTGSLILTGAGDLEGAVRDSGLLAIVAPPQPQPLGQMAQLGLMQADAGIRRRTEGALDIRSALAVVLVGLAVLQAARGRLAAPAITLLLSALSLVELPRR
jgi:hypothetical protein